MCIPKAIPDARLIEAAAIAWEENPANRPNVRRAVGIVGPSAGGRSFIAAVTTKYWRGERTEFGVSFLDTDDAELKRRILSHLNAWSARSRVRFRASGVEPDVRIARMPGDGYWSYLGTDIQLIPDDEPTMNLDSFTMRTSEREYKRVVRHEAGHTLGFPHEHLRKDLIDRIDRRKAIRYFAEQSGWSAEETVAQVLTPIDEADLIATESDELSIMCYQLPGSITIDGNPIEGGLDLTALDRQFVRHLYPNPARPRKAKKKAPAKKTSAKKRSAKKTPATRSSKKRTAPVRGKGAQKQGAATKRAPARLGASGRRRTTR
jgi:hypothetical protein